MATLHEIFGENLMDCIQALSQSLWRVMYLSSRSPRIDVPMRNLWRGRTPAADPDLLESSRKRLNVSVRGDFFIFLLGKIIWHVAHVAKRLA